MKFAHMADIHLGFQKQELLQRIEREVFENAVEQCISRKVDFVLIPGDIFHVNIPEMKVQKFAFAMFRRLYEEGIPVYVVYGSHDFSPVSNSVIDLLVEVGYITKVTRAVSSEDGAVHLNCITDAKTGVKITGLSGLKVGKDREWYEKLDRQSLESESGLKIFLFHGGISDMKTESGMDGDHMPLSLLPKGFAYYAGGHMHKFNHQQFADYSHVVYPGTPFAGYHSDLEENAKGMQRGFVIVEFDDAVRAVEFVPIANTLYDIIEIDANNRKSESINQELQEKAKSIDPTEKIIIIKIQGEMTSGKTSNVDTSGIRDQLVNSGALVVNISRNRLTSKEYSITGSTGASKQEVESGVFKENIGQLRLSQKKLLGDDGVDLAKKLLHQLSQSQMVNEKKGEYVARIKNESLAILEVD